MIGDKIIIPQFNSFVAIGIHKSFNIERIFCIKNNDIPNHDFKISSFLCCRAASKALAQPARFYDALHHKNRDKVPARLTKSPVTE